MKTNWGVSLANQVSRRCLLVEVFIQLTKLVSNSARVIESVPEEESYGSVKDLNFDQPTIQQALRVNGDVVNDKLTGRSDVWIDASLDLLDLQYLYQMLSQKKLIQESIHPLINPEAKDNPISKFIARHYTISWQDILHSKAAVGVLLVNRKRQIQSGLFRYSGEGAKLAMHGN